MKTFLILSQLIKTKKVVEIFTTLHIVKPHFLSLTRNKYFQECMKKFLNFSDRTLLLLLKNFKEQMHGGRKVEFHKIKTQDTKYFIERWKVFILSILRAVCHFRPCDQMPNKS